MTENNYTRSGTQVTGGSFTQAALAGVEIYIAPPAPGEYLLRIFAREGDSGKSSMVLEIGVVADESDGVRLPTAYQSFHADGCFLHGPVGSPVLAGEECSFEIALPGYADAFMSDGKNRIPMTKSSKDDVFFVSTTVPACKKLTIYAGTSSSGRYTGIVSFPVES